MNYAHLGSESPCEGRDEALGMENGSIADFQIISSTVWGGYSAEDGRLNGDRAWVAKKNDRNQWIQVDLGELKIVTKIATQGRKDEDQWVTTYNVSYGQKFNQYQVYSVDKVRD